MFMVSAPAPMLGLLHHPHQIACRRNLKLEAAEEQAQEQIKKLSTASTGSLGGLRRTVSSLQAVKQCVFDAPTCACQASDVEIHIKTSTDKPFLLRVCAPNGETSERFFFPMAKSARFSPIKGGCGHGTWTFELEPINADDQQAASKKADVPALRTEVHLTGVGNLYYTVDDSMNIKLTGQEFLHLPSAASACNASHN